MIAKVFSAAIVGLDAQIIEVEVDASYGLRHFERIDKPGEKPKLCGLFIFYIRNQLISWFFV